MAAIDKTTLTARLRAAIAKDPSTLVFGAQSVQGRRGNVVAAPTLQDPGPSGSAQHSYMTVRADWTTEPAKGDTLAVGATTYRVIRTAASGDTVSLRIDVTGEFGTEGTRDTIEV